MEKIQLSWARRRETNGRWEGEGGAYVIGIESTDDIFASLST